MDKRKQLAEICEKIICLDGYDDAIVGVAGSQHGIHAIYSVEKIIASLTRDMTAEEAYEYYIYTIAGLRFDENFPIFQLMVDNLNAK
jgi:hypothetical protein